MATYSQYGRLSHRVQVKETHPVQKQAVLQSQAVLQFCRDNQVN